MTETGEIRVEFYKGCGNDDRDEHCHMDQILYTGDDPTTDLETKENPVKILLCCCKTKLCNYRRQNAVRRITSK